MHEVHVTAVARKKYDLDVFILTYSSNEVRVIKIITERCHRSNGELFHGMDFLFAPSSAGEFELMYSTFLLLKRSQSRIQLSHLNLELKKQKAPWQMPHFAKYFAFFNTLFKKQPTKSIKKKI